MQAPVIASHSAPFSFARFRVSLGDEQESPVVYGASATRISGAVLQEAVPFGIGFLTLILVDFSDCKHGTRGDSWQSRSVPLSFLPIRVRKRT